jgi:hypothetical protein
MSNQDKQTPASKIISIFSKTAKKKEVQGSSLECETHEQINTLSLTEIMQKNKQNKERLRSERLKTNETVLKSYKIK